MAAERSPEPRRAHGPALTIVAEWARHKRRRPNSYVESRPQQMNTIGQRAPSKECTDCGCDLQWVNSRWRCPWVSLSRERQSTDQVVTCSRPFTRKVE